MADCLLHLWKEMAQDAPDEEPEEVEKLTPPYGAAFVDLKYLDRKTEIEKEGIVIVPGILQSGISIYRWWSGTGIQRGHRNLRKTGCINRETVPLFWSLPVRRF